MVQSMIDFINAEYKENQQRFIKQVEPLTKFFEAGYEASPKKDEEVKVRGQQELDFGMKWSALTGGEEPSIVFEQPTEGKQVPSPQAQYEAWETPYLAKQKTTADIAKVRDLGELEYGSYMKEAEKWGIDNKITDIQQIVGYAKELSEKADRARTLKKEARIKAEKEKTTAKKVTTFTNKLIEIGASSFVEETLGKKVEEKEAELIYARIMEKSKGWELIDGSAKAISPEENFKRAIKNVDMSITDVDKKLKEKNAELKIEQKKKGSAWLGLKPSQAGKHDKEKVAKLQAEIKTLERTKEIQDIFKDIGKKEETGLKVGDIEDGYEYLGGDKSKESSWKKVQ